MTFKDAYIEAMMLNLTEPQKRALLVLILAEKAITREEWKELLVCERSGTKATLTIITIDALLTKVARVKTKGTKYYFSFEGSSVREENMPPAEETEMVRAALGAVMQEVHALDSKAKKDLEGRKEELKKKAEKRKLERESSWSRISDITESCDASFRRLHEAHTAMIDQLTGGTVSQMLALEALDLNPSEEHTFTEIRKAYKSKIQEVHPDKEGGSKEQTHLVTSAFESLKTLTKERAKQQKARRE